MFLLYCIKDVVASFCPFIYIIYIYLSFGCHQLLISASYQVYELVGLKELYYAASHGMDFIGPARHTVCNDHPTFIKSSDEQVSDNKTNCNFPNPLKSPQRENENGQRQTKEGRHAKI